MIDLNGTDPAVMHALHIAVPVLVFLFCAWRMIEVYRRHRDNPERFTFDNMAWAGVRYLVAFAFTVAMFQFVIVTNPNKRALKVKPTEIAQPEAGPVRDITRDRTAPDWRKQTEQIRKGIYE